MNRGALVATLAGLILSVSAFFVLTTREPDDLGDGASPPRPEVADVPPRPAPSASRDTSTPPPPPPSPPSAPRIPKREVTATPKEPATPATATLRVRSDVSGAQVFLNREFVGAAPATAKDLAPGEYQLNVSAPGYDNHVETISLTAGEREIIVNFREVRLNASLDVLHKHRFGSCRGTLVATPQGLRYDTPQKDDAFAASLVELDTFQVDYLNKNLRIQARKGRRYDFTDPDGNADRLFVFHRDVERARERLKHGERPVGR